MHAVPTEQIVETSEFSTRARQGRNRLFFARTIGGSDFLCLALSTVGLMRQPYAIMPSPLRRIDLVASQIKLLSTLKLLLP